MSSRLAMGLPDRVQLFTLPALSSIFEFLMVFIFVLLQLKNGGVAKAKGEGEKENECTTECKSRRRRDEKAPWALNYESGEGGGDASTCRPFIKVAKNE